MDELRKLIKEFFAGDIMRWIGSDHHKQNDGTLEVTYSYYYDDYYQDKSIGDWYQAWTVCHPGYVRGCVEGRGKTLEEAIANFRKDWEQKKKEWKNGLEEFHIQLQLSEELANGSP